MTSNLSDKDILDTMVGGVLLRSMTSLTFLGWISKKINGVPSYSAATQELIGAISHPPMSSAMSDEEKVRLCRKLEALNITIP